MTATEIQDFIQNKISEYKYDKNKNVKIRALLDNKEQRFFAITRPEEEPSGAYHDFSFVAFISDDEEKLLLTLCIGSQGFQNDITLATLPYLRREFKIFGEYKLPNNTKDDSSEESEEIPQETFFIKSDFSDIVSVHPVLEGYAAGEFKKTIEKYKQSIPVGEIISLSQVNEKQVTDRIAQWLALYAKVRGILEVDRKKSHRSIYNGTMKSLLKNITNADESDKAKIAEVGNLLKAHKYIVLQGAPGTGKTRLANQIAAKKYSQHTKFIQFHAETTYGDFIGGLVPKEGNGSQLAFEYHNGILTDIIKEAINNPNDDYLLVIDEINRANLANVLGPIFYLFENREGEREGKINIEGIGEIDRLPDNLYVLATMNTADRSLAVVDFALRRRFIWYTLKPHVIDFSNDPDNKFKEEEFNAMNSIFNKYATDSELNLQPGHSYFIVPKGSDDFYFRNRLKYELMPLIKEYLQEGYLTQAKDDFEQYFKTYADSWIFE